MKQFLLRSFIFLFIPSSYFGVNYMINSNTIDDFIIPNKDENIIIGDSQIDFAIVPSDIIGTFSMAQPAEPYFHSFWKLKRLSRDNKNIKNVILGMSFHNFSSLDDIRTVNKKWSSRIFKNSYTICNYSDLIDVDIDYNQYVKVLLTQMCLKPRDKHCFYYDDFVEDYTVLRSNLDVVIKKHFYNRFNEVYVISKTSNRYLDSIVHFCEENRFNLIPVSTPLHSEYYEKIPEVFKSNFILKKKELVRKGVVVNDYSQYPLPDSCFLDYNHINKRGADKFTVLVDSILKSYN